MNNFVKGENTETVELLTVETDLETLSFSKKSQIAVRIPRNLFVKFTKYVEETGISQTEVIVAALAKYLDSLEDIAVTQKILELEKRIAALEAKI